MVFKLNILSFLPSDEIFSAICGKGIDCSTACGQTESEAATCLNLIYDEDLWESTDKLTKCTESNNGFCGNVNYLHQIIAECKNAFIDISPLQ